MDILGIDIGGSGIKGALVNAATGELLTERRRVVSPPTFQPDEVIASTAELVRQFDYQGPIGVGFPAVVMHGVVMTPPTALAFPGWDQFPLAARLTEALGRPVKVINDADAAGFAEMDFGAVKGQAGTVILFTLGTGIGSSVFLNGHLLPNTEFGRIYLRDSKKTAELQMSDRVREEKDLSWEEWAHRLNDYFQYVELLFAPDLMIVGGGVSRKHEKFLPFIKTRAPIVPAAFRNDAGVVGAAMSVIDEPEPATASA
jgi:polyphosphate glucokinase